MEFVLIISAILLWGVWGFLVKLSSVKIGLQAAFFSSLSLIFLITAYLLFTRQLLPLKMDAVGIMLAVLAGLASAAASIVFYILLGKNPASIVVTATSLYPMVTLVLSVLFLNESLTIIKGLGIILAVIALFLLTL